MSPTATFIPVCDSDATILFTIDSVATAAVFDALYLVDELLVPATAFTVFIIVDYIVGGNH